MANANSTTQGNIIATAGKGAGEGSVNYALQLLSEVDAIKAKAAAEQAAEAQRLSGLATGQAVISNLQQEAAEYGMTSAQLVIYRASLGGASDAQLRHAQGLLKDIDAIKKTAAAEKELTDAQQRGIAAGTSLVASLQRSAATHGLSATQAKIYQAAQDGANRKDIEAAMALAQKERAQRQSDAAVAASVNRTRAANESTGGMGKASMIATESIRGLEDAVAGYTNNGLKGMLQATTNNINQIGALVGGSAGLIISIGSIAALIAVSLIPKLQEWAASTKEIDEANQRSEGIAKRIHEEEMKRLNERFDLMFSKEKAWRDFKAGTKTNETSGSIKSDTESLKEQLAIQVEAKARAAGNLGKIIQKDPNASKPIEDFDKKRKLQWDTAGDWATYGSSFLTGEQTSESEAEEATRKRHVERANELRKQHQEEETAMKQASEKIQMLKDQIAIRDKQFDSKKHEEQVRERNRQAQLLKANEREAEEEMAKEKKDALTKNIQEQKTLAGTLAQNITNLDPSRNEKREIEARRKEIEKARAGGLITDAEAGTLNAANKAKPETLPGNVAAIQAGTKEAYSSVLRAMRNNEQSKLQADAKKLAEEANTILERIEKNTAEKESALLLEF